MKPAGELEDLDDLAGIDSNLDTTNKKFTLHTLGGDFPSLRQQYGVRNFEVCAANNFTFLQNNQVVEVGRQCSWAVGGFLAKKIEFEDEAEDDELEGLVSNRRRDGTSRWLCSTNFGASTT